MEDQDISCSNCGTFITSLWRKGKDGLYLCNACALYYKIHKQNRPKEMRSTIVRQRNRTRKKIRYKYKDEKERQKDIENPDELDDKENAISSMINLNSIQNTSTSTNDLRNRTQLLSDKKEKRNKITRKKNNGRNKMREKRNYVEQSNIRDIISKLNLNKLNENKKMVESYNQEKIFSFFKFDHLIKPEVYCRSCKIPINENDDNNHQNSNLDDIQFVEQIYDDCYDPSELYDDMNDSKKKRITFLLKELYKYNKNWSISDNEIDVYLENDKMCAEEPLNDEEYGAIKGLIELSKRSSKC